MRKFMLLMLFLFFSSVASTYACEASNENGDTCQITCPPGQRASCINNSGVNLPTCECLTDNITNKNTTNTHPKSTDKDTKKIEK